MSSPIQSESPRGLGRTHRLEPDPPRRRERPQRPEGSHRKLAGKAAFIILAVLAVVTGSLAGMTLVYSADLPQIQELESYRPSTTTDLYDIKGRVIGSFALQRRVIVDYNGFAPILRQAVVSIEDKDFYSHGGINLLRIWGAAWHDVRSHGRAQGASTLTMQLARDLFLSADRTLVRKVEEAYLAIQIERTFTKEQIFTLYGNQIYLGSGQYGFEAASEYYFGKHARDVNLTEAALLAGLPKGPAAYSPILNPEKSLRRRNLVLSEMESDGVITHEEAERARAAPLGLRISQPNSTIAPWFQEEVRRELERRFGTDEVHEAGLRVDTTLDLDLQKVANAAVLDGLAAYEHRHGWKGNLENVLAEGESLDDYKHPDWAQPAHGGDYVHAVVTNALPLAIRAKVGDSQIVIEPDGWRWTGQRYGDALVKPGDVIYVHMGDTFEGGNRRAALEQDSGAQGALMAMDNTNGDVLALVGGRDFALSQFDRATQAERQTGSSFKPYVYTAAIEDGVKPDDIIVDGPVSFGSYVPHDYENNFKGAMTIVNAFAESRNIPALKLAARVGIHNVIDVAHRFGVTTTIPPYLPIALGAVEITLEEQVASYSVFPNDGIRMQPRLIRKVSNADGITLWEDPPVVKEVISQETARTMMTLLRAVTAHGTGAAAAELNHPLGGKTGTTSDFTDAWFMGFSPSVTCGVWMGYDSRETLGNKETGARAALPVWMVFMKQAIAGKDDERFIMDQGTPPMEAKAELEKGGTQTRPDRTASRAPAIAEQPASAPPYSGSARSPQPGTRTGGAIAPASPATGAVPARTHSVGPAPRPSADSPLVRPALPRQAVPKKPQGVVKSALPGTSGN
ncbi:MAG: PBP1A family penicillin-binding protein [Terracidiphilus sp.]